MNSSVPGADYTPAPEHPELYTPLSLEQLNMIQSALINDDNALHASVLITAASYPRIVHSPEDNTEEDLDGVAKIRALRTPAYVDPDAAWRRINRVVDAETEPCHERKQAGQQDGSAGLRSLGFHLLELGFTVAANGGVDCTEVEEAVSRAYGLPNRAS